VLVSSAHARTLSLPDPGVRGPTVDEGIRAAVNIHLAAWLCHFTECPLTPLEPQECQVVLCYADTNSEAKILT
jgi:hypothetical protein